MSTRLLIQGLLGLWAVLVVCSVLVPMITAPSDFGFTRGMNRVTLFFQFQFAAMLVGLVLFTLARGQPPGGLRRIAHLPALLALLLVLAVLAVILWATFSRPDGPGYTPPGPVTPPAQGQDG